MQDLRYAMRALLRNPAFAIVVIVTLALGIGANTAMFSLIHATLLKPLPFKDPGRLVLASSTFGGNINPWTSQPDYYDYRDQSASFERLAATSPEAFRLFVVTREQPERAAVMVATADLFATLGVEPVAGRWFAAEEGKAGAPYVVMISSGLATRRFGGAREAIGQTLTIQMGMPRGNMTATVVGVMPAGFRLLDDADLWMPIREGENDGPQTRQFHNWLLIGRLKPGITLAQARQDVDIISSRLQRQFPDFDRGLGLLLEPLQRGLARDQTPGLFVLMAAVGMVLLIACANAAGLLMARGTVRRPELALRAALGASRARIASQLLTESLVMAFLSGLLGLALAIWLQRLLPIVAGLAPLGIQIGGLATPVLCFALAATMATGLLFGLAPALRAAAPDLACDLAHNTRATGTRAGTRLRSALVVGQVAVSLALLIGAGLLIRSFARLAAVDPGFDARNVMTGEIQLPDTKYPEAERQVQFFESLQEDLAAIPGVTAVGFIDRLPIRHPYGNPPMWAADHPPQDPSQRTTADLRSVLPGYFEAVRIPLLSGRDIAKADRASKPNVTVINERMARTLFPGVNPIGKIVMVAGNEKPVAYEIVGIVGDARIDSIGQNPRMAMYASFYQFPRMMWRFAVRSRLNPEVLKNAIRQRVAAHDRDVTVERLDPMEQVIGESLVSQRVTTVTLTMFSGVALLLASLGLYGVLSYYVAQRTREIGVRMAIGADTRSVLALVLGRSARMVLPGLAIGVAASLAGARLIQDLLFEVRPADPMTFVGVVFCLGAVAFLASTVPAWRAARIDPIRALKIE
jgi:putative ABC transport system permease protein